MKTVQLSIEGLNAAISNKPNGFNTWILICFKNRPFETRTLRQFYTEMLFTIANF